MHGGADSLVRQANKPGGGRAQYGETVELEIDSPGGGEFQTRITAPEDRDPAGLDSALAQAVANLGAEDEPVQLWVRAATSADDATAARFGFEPYRDLWQLRCRLPAPGPALDTRPFTPADIDDLVAVNNRAFAWHPEQGGLTAAAVRERMDEPWFDPDGLRLHHDGDRLAGFCWTKVHADASPPLGEIYVIALDPDFHGRGLGAPMTRSGLAWLADRGLRCGMLYVESDNHAANAAYRKIGFVPHHTDRAYRRPAHRPPPGSAAHTGMP